MVQAADARSAPNEDEQASDEEQRQSQIAMNQELIALLDSWMNVDEEGVQEQKETLEYLMKALDEDRPSYRKLFS